MAQQPISIIGAGLGGLTLARCLSQRGISAVLYEKAPNVPRYAYGITLHASTYGPLLKTLGLDESTFKKRVAVDSASGGSGSIHPAKTVYPEQIQKGSFRAHRGRLESLLREGLDVRWEHSVKSLEIADDTNTLRFQDGDEIKKGCVTGTDGGHSNVRKSVLPEAELNILPFVTFNGKRRIKRSVFEQLYAPVMGDTNVIEKHHNGTLLQISLNDIAEEVSISWVFSRAAHDTGDALYMPNRPLAGATDIPDEFYEEVKSLNHLEQPFQDIFDVEKLKTDRILSWLMRTLEIDSADLERLANSNVFLIGDAAHVEPILGGEGANAAIADAMALSDVISSHGIAAVPEWYKSQIVTWQKGVEESKRQIHAVHQEPLRASSNL